MCSIRINNMIKYLYKTIFVLFFLVILNDILKCQKLHAIVVSDTEDSQIDAACFKDKEVVGAELTTISQVLGVSLKLTEIFGEEFKVQRIINSINNIRCSKNDVIFFYYSGHGARSRSGNSKWPQMSINLNDIDNRSSYYLPLSKVIKLIKQKSPGLMIVIADCCNNVSDVVLPDVISKGQTTVKDNVKLVEVYKNLFLLPKGEVVVSSSMAGEYSIAYKDQASLFTSKYFRSIADALNGNILANWNSVLDNARSLTKKQADSHGQSQTPQFEINIRNTPTPDPNVPVFTKIELINSLLNRDKRQDQRLRLVDEITNKCFTSPDVIVETFAKDQQTLIERESARRFVLRLATSSSIVKVIKLKENKDSSGKFEKLTIYEIVKL